MSKRFFMLLLLFLLVFSGSSAYAFSSYNKETYTLPKGTVHEGDLAVSGENIIIEGTVNGDLYSFGKNVLINGDITGDLITFSMNTNVVGKVNGNIRAFSNRVIINGEVGRNVTAAAQSLTINSGSQVSANVLMFVHHSQLNGKIGGGVNGSIYDLMINGQISDDISSLHVSKLGIGKSAVIEGDVHYTSPHLATIEPDARITGMVSHTPVEPPNKFSRISPFWMAMTLLTTLTLWLLIRYLLPQSLLRIRHTLDREPGKCLGLGTLIFIATPILIVILGITIIGIPLGIVLGVSFSLLVYLAKIFLGTWIGASLTARYNWRMHSMWSELLGILGLFILIHLPFIGWLATLLTWMIFLGAVIRALHPLKTS